MVSSVEPFSAAGHGACVAKAWAASAKPSKKAGHVRSHFPSRRGTGAEALP